MNNENTISLNSTKIIGIFEPLNQEFKKYVLNSNGITQSLPENLKKLVSFKEVPTLNDIRSLLSYSHKPEDWLEICFNSEKNQKIDHENLWISGLEKFNASALYLENLGYFYFQRSKYHKSLEYLSKSHALENSFFAISLAIAAAYALTQYHLVLEYFKKLGLNEQSHLNEELLMKVATSALHEQEYDLSMKIFRSIQEKNKIQPLPELKEFLITKFGNEVEMKTWSQKMSEHVKNDVDILNLTMDECITYASILIHEDKFKNALDYLLKVKKEKFQS